MSHVSLHAGVWDFLCYLLLMEYLAGQIFGLRRSDIGHVAHDELEHLEGCKRWLWSLRRERRYCSAMLSRKPCPNPLHFSPQAQSISRTRFVISLTHSLDALLESFWVIEMLPKYFDDIPCEPCSITVQLFVRFLPYCIQTETRNTIKTVRMQAT